MSKRQELPTKDQYDTVILHAKNTFLKKTRDYGTSWRVYRIISVADQIYIKAKRIRNIQQNKLQLINDNVISEFEGILNYSIIGLVQLDINNDEPEMLPASEVEKLYNEKVDIARQLMHDKNHDYGEAWREMSQESLVDLTLSKVLRIKQIIANGGKTIASEGIDANLFDIFNYAAFALILINEGHH